MNTARTSFFKNKRVWVSAHSGSLGAAIVRRLWRERCELVLADPSQLDLLRQEQVQAWFRRQQPDIVFLTAPGLSRRPTGAAAPASLLHDHLVTNLNVLAAAQANGVGTLVNLTATCVPALFDRAAASNGAQGSESIAVAGWAGIRLTQAYSREHGGRFHVLATDVVYDPASPDDLAAGIVTLSRLVEDLAAAALRGKPMMAVAGELHHPLLDVDDLAEAALIVAQTHDGGAPVACGLSGALSLRLVAELVADVVDYHGELALPAAPEPAIDRCSEWVDATSLGWRARMPLRDRIRKIHERWLRDTT